LLQVEVSLPLREPIPVRTAPAAVTVLTGEDIRRSGAVTLPEVLRYAPGLFVGRYSASSWVVTSRGFAGTAANKLLVMRDGRTGFIFCLLLLLLLAGCDYLPFGFTPI
jgi:iron complex outermembrane receptor protein